MLLFASHSCFSTPSVKLNVRREEERNRFTCQGFNFSWATRMPEDFNEVRGVGQWKKLLAHRNPCRSSRWRLPVQRMGSTSAADPQGAAVCPQHATPADFWAGSVRRLAWPETESLSAAPSGVKHTPTAAHFHLLSFHSQDKWTAKKNQPDTKHAWRETKT